MHVWKALSTDVKIPSKGLGQALSDFKPFLIAILLISVISTICSTLTESVQGVLIASPSTPWGVVTSIFVNSSVDKLISNISGLLMYSLFFSLANFFLPSSERRGRSLIITVLVFPSAIISNIFWIALFPQLSASGTSGIVYGLEGTILVFAFANLSIFKHLEKLNLLSVMTSLINPCIIIMVLSDILFQLLNVTFIFISGINILVHYFSFATSLILTLMWIFIRYRHTTSSWRGKSERGRERWRINPLIWCELLFIVYSIVLEWERDRYR